MTEAYGMTEKIGLEEAKRELGDLKAGYDKVLEEFNGNIHLRPQTLFHLYGNIQHLVKRENTILDRMRLSFPEGTPEREETRKLYEMVKSSAEAGEKAVMEAKK